MSILLIHVLREVKYISRLYINLIKEMSDIEEQFEIEYMDDEFSEEDDNDLNERLTASNQTFNAQGASFKQQ